ncbi:MAG: DUF4139 domain-containing protein [Balneolales bacterium]
MKLITISLFIISLMHMAVDSYAQDSNRKALNITLYQNGFGMVHDKRGLEISQGTSIIDIGNLPRDIISESVFADFDGQIIEQSFNSRETYWSEAIYKHLVDQSIRLVSENGELVEGVLRSYKHGQIWLEDSDGEFIFIQNAHSYRLHSSINPDILSTSPQLTWTIESEEDGLQDVSIYYQVGNMRWSADYNLVLDEDEESMDLHVKATMTNHSGIEYPDARIRLVSGDLNVQPRQQMSRRDVGGAEMMKMNYADVAPETMFEYHVFDLPERITLNDQEQKQITLKRASGIEAHKHYRYQTGPLGQLQRNNNKVDVEFRLANTEEFKLGTPLPAGIVKVYQKADERVEFIGEDQLEHTPVDQDFTISVGQAFDVIVEEKQVRLAELSNRVREEDREITITNQKEQDITVEVELRLNQNEELRSSSIQGKEVEARRYIFDVPVEAESKETLSLQLRRSN